MKKRVLRIMLALCIALAFLLTIVFSERKTGSEQLSAFPLDSLSYSTGSTIIRVQDSEKLFPRQFLHFWWYIASKTSI